MASAASSNPGAFTKKLDDLATGLQSKKPAGSTTLAVVEQAGRPQVWLFGQNVGLQPFVNKGPWAAELNSIGIRGHTEDGLLSPGPCAINCTNQDGVYAFHPGGANAVFADGHVAMLHQGLDIWVLFALTTARGGETLANSDL